MIPCHGQTWPLWRRWRSVSKGIAEHRSRRAFVGVGIQGRGRTSDWKGIRRRRGPRARASKGVAGDRTRRASKGVGIEGRGHRRVIRIVFIELLRSFRRMSRIYTAASSPPRPLVPRGPGEADSFRHCKNCFNNIMT